MPPHDSRENNQQDSMYGPSYFFSRYILQEAELIMLAAEVEYRQDEGFIFVNNIGVPIPIAGNDCFRPDKSPDTEGRLVLLKDGECELEQMRREHGFINVWCGPPGEGDTFEGLLEAEIRGIWVRKK